MLILKVEDMIFVLCNLEYKRLCKHIYRFVFLRIFRWMVIYGDMKLMGHTSSSYLYQMKGVVGIIESFSMILLFII